MGDTTKIAWCDHTLNFWIGCHEVVLHSNGVRVPSECDNCYARDLARNRMGFNGTTKPVVWGPSRSTPRHRTAVATWNRAYAWDRYAAQHGRELVFEESLSDLFEFHPDLNKMRHEVWELVERCPNLDHLMLTKRIQNVKRMVPQSWLQNWPGNVWIGTSAGTQEAFDLRLPYLADIDAPVRFLSVEPLLGPVDITRGGIKAYALDWVITGGESGPGRRAWNPDWARAIRDQCLDRSIAYFHKQGGALKPGLDPELDGRTWHQFPDTDLFPVGGVRAMAGAEMIATVPF